MLKPPSKIPAQALGKFCTLLDDITGQPMRVRGIITGVHVCARKDQSPAYWYKVKTRRDHEWRHFTSIRVSTVQFVPDDRIPF